MIEDRPYQRKAVETVFAEFESGISSTALVMPTGTGKTTVAAMIAGRARSTGRRSLFLARREILVNQAAETLRRHGLKVGIEMAGEDAQRQAARYGEMPDVVVATVQSMKGQRLASWDEDSFGLIITDECHEAGAASHRTIYDHFKGRWHLGITATLDGARSGLGTVYQTKCWEYRLRDAINDEWLVPIEGHRCRIRVDLRGLKLERGDYRADQLAERIGPRMEELCDGICQEVADRPTIVFTPDVWSARTCAEVLTAKGMQARYVAGEGGNFGMPKAERKALLRDFRDRKYQTIVCNELLVQGWDCPFIEAVVVARPTKQRYRFVQMTGRGTRPSPETGKKSLLLVDFDWQTDDDARDLMHSPDLFLDAEDPADGPVRRMVQRAVEEFGETDIKEAVEQAEFARSICGNFLIHLTGVKAVYDKVSFDPVGVSKLIDVKLSKYDRDPWKSGHATDAQLRYLRKLGVTEPGKLSRWGATKLIKALVKRQDSGKVEPAGLQKLLRLGMDETNARVMTRTQADAALTLVGSVRQLAEGILFPKDVL